MLMPDERLPFGYHMIRVEHPEPCIYTFSLTGLRFFVWVKDFNRKHGMYEANKRTIIRRCTALLFDDRMTEPFRITAENYLKINGETLRRITERHAMRNSNPSRIFEDSELRLFFEPYTNGLNDAVAWMENAAIKWQRDNRRPRLVINKG